MPDIRIEPEAFQPLIDQAVASAIRRLHEDRPGGPERLLLSKREASEMLGVSLATLDRLTAPRGDLRPVRLDGRVLYSKTALAQWIASKEAAS